MSSFLAAVSRNNSQLCPAKHFQWESWQEGQHSAGRATTINNYFHHLLPPFFQSCFAQQSLRILNFQLNIFQLSIPQTLLVYVVHLFNKGKYLPKIIYHPPPFPPTYFYHEHGNQFFALLEKFNLFSNILLTLHFYYRISVAFSINKWIPLATSLDGFSSEINSNSMKRRNGWLVCIS